MRMQRMRMRMLRMRVAGCMRKHVELILPELSYRVTGLCFSVHNELGRFRSERQYGDALAVAFAKEGVGFEREVMPPPQFDGEGGGRNRIDFLVERQLVLELKTKPFITREDYAQVRRYLFALDARLGIIVNFRQKFLSPKRVLNAAAKHATLASGN